MQKLRHGNSYYLRGMLKRMWQVPHPEYGAPDHLVGIYLGFLRGTRRWHGFEVRVKGKDKGVIFMPESDLAKLKVEDLGPYKVGTHDHSRGER